MGAGFRSHGSGILVHQHGCGNGSQGRGPQATSAVAGASPPTEAARSRRSGPPAIFTARRSYVLLAVTLALRLWGIKQGLPYSYNVDEATHFVPRAIAFFSHDYNPQYFLNPPGVFLPAAPRLRALVRQRRRRSQGVRQRPDQGLRGRPGGRGGAGDDRRVAHLSDRRAAVRAPGGAGRRRPSSGSRSCPSSTATWRSTTFPRWPRWRCRCTGPPGCCAGAGGATT